jgi:hypothetical protein
MMVVGVLSLLSSAPTCDPCAQDKEKDSMPFKVPSLFKLELSQNLDPSRRWNRLATDRFKLVVGNDALSLIYSDQPPPVLDRLQLGALPFGYRLVEASLKRKWGSFVAFRSMGYDPGISPPQFAETVSGGAVELPKTPLAMQVSGYFLRASYPGRSEPPAGGSALLQGGSQFGLTASREFQRGFRLQSEWSYTRREEGAGKPGALEGNAVFVTLTGRNRLADTSLTYRARGSGFGSPALSVHGQAAQQIAMTLQRKFMRHQFSYSSQMDSSQPLGHAAPVTGVHREGVRWTFTPRLWPVLSAAKTWLCQTSPDRSEREDNLSLSLSKTVNPLALSLAYLGNSRMNIPSRGTLWRRNDLLGDASLAISRKEKVEFHYERGDMVLGNQADQVLARSMRLSTQLFAWQGKLALTPVWSYQTQRQRSGAGLKSALGFVLSAQIKLPRQVPGTDLLLSFAALHSDFLPVPARNCTNFVMRWNFRSW